MCPEQGFAEVWGQGALTWRVPIQQDLLQPGAEADLGSLASALGGESAMAQSILGRSCVSLQLPPVTSSRLRGALRVWRLMVLAHKDRNRDPLILWKGWCEALAWAKQCFACKHMCQLLFPVLMLTQAGGVDPRDSLRLGEWRDLTCHPRGSGTCQHHPECPSCSHVGWRLKNSLIFQWVIKTILNISASVSCCISLNKHSLSSSSWSQADRGRQKPCC